MKESKQIKYYNTSHETIIETLKKAGVKIVYPIYLIGDRKADFYNVSCNFMSVDVIIPKSEINEEEVQNLPKDAQIQLRTVWSCKL